MGNVNLGRRILRLDRYDCSSADINPIGSISKNDLKRFIVYTAEDFDLPILRDFVKATPTAELVPIQDGKPIQSDEEEMGMTYGEFPSITVYANVLN